MRCHHYILTHAQESYEINLCKTVHKFQPANFDESSCARHTHLCGIEFHSIWCRICTRKNLLQRSMPGVHISCAVWLNFSEFVSYVEMNWKWVPIEQHTAFHVFQHQMHSLKTSVYCIQYTILMCSCFLHSSSMYDITVCYAFSSQVLILSG